MPMEITLGLHLDGQRATEPSHLLGQAMVGPMGLLSILETQFGLLAIEPSHAERIVQYRNRLAFIDSPSRFFHASFATDALGTAATLLGWRDLWHLHGWDGTFSEVTKGRLADLAAVEEVTLALAPSVGERLAAILKHMVMRKPAIACVTLLDPPDAFPKRWREVLAQIPMISGQLLSGADEGYLSRLQTQLDRAVRGERVEVCPWQNDGSVLVVQAETRTLAGAWVASQVMDSVPTMLLAASDGAQLDASLVGGGCARHGLGETSPFRPALQVLPLALEILWKPLDFNALIRFLMNPICPVPGFARRRMAEKFADAPGIGGKRWEETLVDIDQHYGQSRALAVREKITLWVEHDRFDPDEGAPLSVVRKRVDALWTFFQTRMGGTDPVDQFANQAGYAQCRACADALGELQAQGLDAIRPRQLQRLVAQVTANGSGNPMLVAEVGAQRVITHPGAAIEPVERLIWWQLGQQNTPAAYPWSPGECRALVAAGIALPSYESRLAQAALEWVRPVLAARRQLCLVLAPPGEETHPLWQMIEAIAGKPTIIPLESTLCVPSPVTRAVGHMPLAVPKRWWKLPQDLPVPRTEAVSPTNAELLLFNPYQWLLKYPAQLRPSRILALGDDFRLLGNLAHGLVELLYKDPGALSMSDADYLRWYAPVFSQLVEQEGASLLMSGRRADLEAFRHRLCQSVLALRHQVAGAGVVQVDPEMALNGSFVGGLLRGKADLVMKDPGAKQVIIDMKWAGHKRYSERLKSNRHLQLAMYAEMARQEHGTWPGVAYYILNQASMIAPDARFLPCAEVVLVENGENLPQLWQRFLESWRWRSDQMAAGWFEVVIDGIDEDKDSVPPVSAMGAETLNEAYSPYRSLAGWEA